MKLVAESKGFQIYFNTTDQTYSVYKDGLFLIGGKCRYSEVEIYLT